MYIELHAASAFSFLQGASLPETLVERAAALGYPALALLDADGVYGAPRFHKAAKQAGLRAIIGAELTIAASRRLKPALYDEPPLVQPSRRAQSSLTAPSIQSLDQSSIANHQSKTSLSAEALAKADQRSKIQDHQWRLPLLVASGEGYRNLCRLVTRMKMRAPKGEGALALEELEGCTGGLVAMAGRPLLETPPYGAGGLLDRLVGLFGRGQVVVELQRHLLRDEEADNAALTQMAQAFRVPVIATNGVRFAGPGDRPLFDVLTCLYHRTTLDEAGRRLARNAERYLKSPEQMARLFADRPDALAGAAALAERLEYTMADLGYRFPSYPVPHGHTEISWLRQLTDAGAHDRFRPYHEKARAQIARELDLIERLDLAGYFLIVWDIVRYCREQDILVQGRGSAANSAVCYSLGITAVDPIQMDLLFERFLSEERGEWPDIDLDLPSGDRREQVIQHVYEKYGRLGAAMTANVITYRGRSAAREVGKVLSIPEDEIDRLTKLMHRFEYADPNETLARNLAEAGVSIDAPRMRLFATLWQQMQDLPRHLGQHSGGMVVCQGALDSVVPLEPASMPGRVVVQWDKDDCADMGIVKVDLLGLGMMAVLQDAIALVNTGMRTPGRQPLVTELTRRREDAKGSLGARSREGVADAGGDDVRTPGRQPLVTDLTRRREDTKDSLAGCGAAGRFDLASIPPDDPAVYALLQNADTIGVFQVESRAQMATLPRLKPERFYDLVIEVAIIRPGPIVGQMVHPYLNRRAGREDRVPLHPSLEPVLRRTLGVPLFQEQLLRMAMVAAGFTGGQAEELRRAMGFKRSEKRMATIATQLREGMARNGITGETAERIITSITSFALYGFPESHAASFALLAYASAYLKVHHADVFYTALLNNQPMGFYHPATLVKDAQRRGVRFHPIDVQQSDWLCRIEPDGAIRLGLMYVNGLRKEVGQAIAAMGRLKPAPTYVGAGFSRPDPPACPKCGADDGSLIEIVRDTPSGRTCFCNICSHDWTVARRPAGLSTVASASLGEAREAKAGLSTVASASLGEAREALSHIEEAKVGLSTVASASLGVAREALSPVEEAKVGLSTVASASLGVAREAKADRFSSIEMLVQRTGLRRDELATLADIGALNAFTGDRRSALWQVERAVRPSGELWAADERHAGSDEPSPLRSMTPIERLAADYTGTGLTIGPHPMKLRRGDPALRGVLRASDLPQTDDGRRVRVAGMVITRQRPGTAKGFVFLTLEDETGISNVIVRPDLFDRERTTVVGAPFLIVHGVLQHQDGVRAVKAEHVEAMADGASVEAHDFY